MRTLEEAAREASGCTRCKLAQGRTQVVYGSGDPNADLMFIGEAPGFHEDARNTSATRSSMSLTTMVYCFGVLSPGPRTVTLGAGPDHCAPAPIPDFRMAAG